MWLAQEKSKTAWLSLDVYNLSPSEFYRSLCRALLEAHPRSASLSLALSNEKFDASPVEHSSIAISGLSKEERSGKLRALVIDDVHLIQNEKILRSLSGVLENLPDSYRVMLLGRESKKVISALSLDCGAILRVGEKELRFSFREVRDCFAAFGGSISYSEARFVRKASGGWPIAVGALAASNIVSLSQSGAEDVLRKGMKAHLWDYADNGTRTLLLRTCIVEEIEPGLCAALTGDLASVKVLERLVKNSPLVRTAAGGGYIYHPIARDFLLETLREQGEVDARLLYETAARHYLDAGKNDRALHCAIKSENSELVAEAISVTLPREEVESIASWTGMFRARFAGIPERFKYENPGITVLFAWYFNHIGTAGAADNAFDRLYEVLPEIEFSGTLNWTMALDRRVSLDNVREKVRGISGERADISAGFLVPAITGNLPFFHRGARELSTFPGLPDDTSAFRRLTSALPSNVAAVLENALAAGVLYEKNMLSESLSRSERCEACLSDVDAPDLAFIAKMATASALEAMGRRDEAFSKRREIALDLDLKKAFHLGPNFFAYEAKLRMSDGEREAASEWLGGYYVAPDSPLEQHEIFQHFTTARALMITDSFERARGYIERLIALTEDFGRTVDRAEALALMAILEWHRGKREPASKRLEDALLSVQNYAFIRVFANEGGSLLPIVKRLIVVTDKEDYGGKLNSRYLKQLLIAAYAHSKKHAGIAAALEERPVRLSRQQKLMIWYLAKGYNNPEIAEAANLSLNTVKVHTMLSYKKLGVNNSADAVIKAYELGLIGADPPPDEGDGKVDRRLKSASKKADLLLEA
ncbi:MAG: LuxR C-terminal-related transcriptional regulator [Synergistaceae bacterium]|nr:LuxR C-terminal-related transcriptional regulator [Synergistaceae bacterium]